MAIGLRLFRQTERLGCLTIHRNPTTTKALNCMRQEASECRRPVADNELREFALNAQSSLENELQSKLDLSMAQTRSLAVDYRSYAGLGAVASL